MGIINQLSRKKFLLPSSRSGRGRGGFSRNPVDRRKRKIKMNPLKTKSQIEIISNAKKRKKAKMEKKLLGKKRTDSAINALKADKEYKIV